MAVSYYVHATKTVPVDFVANIVGDGLWGTRESKGLEVKFDKVDITINAYPEGEGLHWYGDVNVHHDCDARQHGLLYTDSIEKQVAAELMKRPALVGFLAHASGSEQGMQDRWYLSMDISVKQTYFTIQQLLALGFEVEETVEEY